MDRVARLPVAERRALFTETAARAGISAVIVEKDFWVCWTLSRLYTTEGIPGLLFKGGTSLSKCFRLIERFSEDIDLGIRREDMGLGEDAVPSQQMGSSRRKKASKHLQRATEAYVADRLVPLLRAEIERHLGDSGVLQALSHETEAIVEFHYPRALESSAYGPGTYIAPGVRLELGARSDHHSTAEVEISSYAAERFPSFFEQPRCRVVAQAPERTLLEKALILHTDIAKGRVASRSSRHAYDLAMMERAGTASVVTRALFEQVALHKLVFSDDRHAARAPAEGIMMVPPESLRKDLESDYRSMEEMFFQEPPAFAEVLESLRTLERAINSL